MFSENTVVIDQVTVFNPTPQEVAGTLSIRGPDEDEIFVRRFVLDPGKEEATLVTYQDVLEQPGEHTVSLELEQRVNGTTSLEKTMHVTNPDVQRLYVDLGREEGERIDLSDGLEENSES